jgi:hypothetical protein
MLEPPRELAERADAPPPPAPENPLLPPRELAEALPRDPPPP